MVAELISEQQRQMDLALPSTAGTGTGDLLLWALLGSAGLVFVVWAMRWQNYFVVALASIGLLAGILLYLEGWPRLKHWLFPLLFLAFMVPLPFVDLASPWLESFTAQSATALARLAGISAVQQGGEIMLPNTTIVVGLPVNSDWSTSH